MSFSTYTITVTYLMAAIGLSAICLVENISAAFIAFVGAAMAVSLILNTRKPVAFPPALWTLLAVLVFALFLMDYLMVSGRLIDASARFLTVFVAFKLFDLKETRDHVILYSLVFFQILAAAASTVSPLFFLLLAAFVMCAIWAMIIFTVKREFDECSSPSETIPDGIFGSTFFGWTVVLTAVSLVITFALFLIIPRMGLGFFESKTLNTVKVVGFSEGVDLGVLGPVKLDSTVVMRVELPGRSEEPPGPLYFRGTALDRYEGDGWTRTIGEREVRGGAGGNFIIMNAAGPLLEQKIMLEPLETEVLFAASRGVVLSGGFPRLWTDATGSIYLAAPPYSRIEYTAWSRLAPGGTSMDRPPSEEEIALYLQLPSTPDLPALKTLADDLTGGNGKNSVLARVMTIESHLKSNYRYTLSPARGAGRTPIEDFLFFTREGYCEHYATAMVLLLRSVGIPARMVTGFLHGRWNEFGGYLLVRQQDAHTWVEAYVDGLGWVSFDPTPPGDAPPASALSGLAFYMDSLRWRWARYVINYSLSDQIGLALTVEKEFTGIREFFRNALREGWPGGTSFGRPVGAALLTMTLLIIFYILKASGGGRVPRAGGTPRFYLDMLSALEKKGLNKEPFETPREFAARSAMAEVTLITEAFQEARYGGRKLVGKDMTRVRRALAALKKSGGA
ncbi:MAG: DUF3488 and transglutaminase-like domain-containing protein [Thermodesulfobacteriota bacterium]